MIIYTEGSHLRSVYFDVEGHVIHYRVSRAEQPPIVTFLSDDTPGAPRLRLTYRLESDQEVLVSFSIAPPGSTEFRPYVHGRAERLRDEP